MHPSAALHAVPIAVLRAFTLCALLLIVTIRCAVAQQQPDKSSHAFGPDHTLVLSISAPWHDVTHNKREQAPYQAILEYVDESGSRHSTPLTIERRGLNRQKMCDFPPIKLRLDKKAPERALFGGSRSIKLVPHCKDGEQWEQNVAEEMLAYRFYNLITDRSFKVQPLTISYVDNKGKSVDGPHNAFLIEDDDVLAKRNGLSTVSVSKPALARFEPVEISRFALFEYMIGNTDWAVLSGMSGKPCCHNSVLIGEATKAGLYAVPYDFDSSGLVDAPYAVPNAVLKTNKVTQRVFRGFCAYNSTLEQARREYLQREPQIVELVRNDARLSARSQKVAQDYLAQFFDVLRDDRAFARDITAKCRK